VPRRDRQAPAQGHGRAADPRRRELHRLHQKLGLVSKVRPAVPQEQHAAGNMHLQGKTRSLHFL
jgi:hypothetical protein